MTGGWRSDPDDRTHRPRLTNLDRARSDGEPTDDSDGSHAGQIPIPAWVPTDDVIGPCPDRQVLVIGTTPTGFVCASLLRAAGYDPVVVSGSSSPPASRITYLTPASVEVLEALGVGVRLVDHGHRVSRAIVRQTGNNDERREWTGTFDGSSRAPALVVPTQVLYRILRDELDGGAASDERGIGTVAPGDDGVDVTFDDGVREWFDLVVDTGGTADGLGRDGDAHEHDRLFQYEATGSDSGSMIREAWNPAAIIQRLPQTADSPDVFRVTTPAGGPAVDEIRRGWTGDRSDPIELPESGSFTRTRVRQVRLPEATLPARWWGGGRVARCGPAACPAAPAAGIGSALGFSDVLGVVWAVTNVEAGVPEAVGTYTTNRARRLADLRRTAACAAGLSAETLAEPLASLAALRAVALEPFFGTAPTALRDPGTV